MRFLITGYPRSRTAWFSVLMSMAGAPCRHEVVRECKSFDDLEPKWPDGTGISDSALGFQLPHILKDIGPRVLVIERDRDEVENSLMKYFEGVPIRHTEMAAQLDLLSDRIAGFDTHPKVCRIRYEALNDVNAVKWAMRWLAPECNTAIAEDAMRLNVQVARSHFLEEIVAQKSRWFLE